MLAILTTVLRRLLLPAALFLVVVPVAQAWSWPVNGRVLQAFAYDEAHPYGAGQHRGIDIGAAAAGDPVVAPASGTVTFAGTVPTGGKCLTIETPGGYAVTLTHLGSIAVARGASVAEGAVVGTIGSSGTAEEAGPYLHLGIRLAADANGYVDPLTFLPALAPPPPPDGVGSPSSVGAGAPASTGGDSASAAGQPAKTATSASEPAIAAETQPAHRQVGSEARHASASASTTRRVGSSASAQRPPRAKRRGTADTRPSIWRRPVEEPAGGFGRRAAPRHADLPRHAPASPLLPLALGAGPGVLAAIAAVATALVRLRRRGRRPAVVVHYPLRGTPLDEGGMRQAA